MSPDLLQKSIRQIETGDFLAEDLLDTRGKIILPKGTAYLTDVGMTGPTDSVIGSDKGAVLERFLSSLPNRLAVATGPCMLNAVQVDVDEKTGKATSIERVDRTIE